jgi:integrase
MGVYQRGNRWYLRISSPEGESRRLSLGPKVKTRVQAEAVLREMERRRLEGKLGILDSSRVSLGQFREEYIAQRRSLVSPETARRDEHVLRTLAGHVGDACLLRSLTSRRISDWAGALKQRGVKTQTVNSYLRHVKRAVRVAAEWGYLGKAPKVDMVPEPDLLPRFLTSQQVELLLSSEHDPLRRRLWAFYVWTGCRRQEALDLQWQDVILGSAPVARVTGKRGKQRLVPLLPPVVQALGEPKDIGPVFPGIRGDRVSHWFKDLARSCGLASSRLHDLRHTAATYMLDKGVRLDMVQEILGHTNITTTRRYAKTIASHIYQAMLEAWHKNDTPNF